MKRAGYYFQKRIHRRDWPLAKTIKITYELYNTIYTNDQILRQGV